MAIFNSYVKLPESKLLDFLVPQFATLDWGYGGPRTSRPDGNAHRTARKRPGRPRSGLRNTSCWGKLQTTWTGVYNQTLKIEDSAGQCSCQLIFFASSRAKVADLEKVDEHYQDTILLMADQKSLPYSSSISVKQLHILSHPYVFAYA